jgi:hypothetical protein
MTNKELRDVLAKYPDHWPVMVRGYEAGLEELIASEVKALDVQVGVHPESSVYGPHLDLVRGDYTAKRNVIKAMLLDRRETEYREEPSEYREPTP